MRDVYHDRLDALEGDLRRMAELAAAALARATWAVLEADLSVAESVAAANESMHAINQDLEAGVLDLIARQQPVARDLRALVAALRMSSELERMGDLAVHIADVASMRHPDGAVPPQLRPRMKEMGRIGVHLAEQVGRLIASKDAEAAAQLSVEDDAVDSLHRTVLRELLATRDTFTMEAAIDATLISRYYERYADHAVNAAEDLIFLVTGHAGRRPVASF